MKKFFLILISILLINNLTFAQVDDIIQLEDTMHTYQLGNGSYSIDGDWSTRQRASYSGTDGGGGVTVISEHAFTQACDILKIKYRMKVHSFCDGNYDRHRSYRVYIEIKDIDENWSIVDGTYVGFSTGGSGGADYDSGEKELAGLSINNVTGIRAVALAGSDAAGGEGRFDGYAEIYEVQVYGEYYIDIGLRVTTNTQVITIGAEDLNEAHKLRIKKGDLTYGIPLVPIGHHNASPIRFYDATPAKAFVKYEK